jgi:hypothetical protein
MDLNLINNTTPNCLLCIIISQINHRGTWKFIGKNKLCSSLIVMCPLAPKSKCHASRNNWPLTKCSKQLRGFFFFIYDICHSQNVKAWVIKIPFVWFVMQCQHFLAIWLGFVQRKQGRFCFYYVDYLNFLKFPLVYNCHFDYSFIVKFLKNC